MYRRIALCSILCLLVLSGCTPDNRIAFDIPGGPAPQTLKEFAGQARVEIIYDSMVVEGVTTNPLQDALSPREGLDKMLSGTALDFSEDPRTGAFAVTRNRILPDTDQLSKSPY